MENAVYAMLTADTEDELAILSLVLQRAGLAVTTARDLSRALASWSDRPADVIVTALSSPDPLAIVRDVRRTTMVPLIVVSDLCGEERHISLLRSGADLVICRPFSASLLIAQVQVLQRRSGGVPYLSLPTLTLAELTLDPATRTVQPAGRQARRLTHLEFRLLYALMINRNQILPTETIVEQVWGYTGEGDRELVRGLVSRLRAKVESDPRNPETIQTVPGIGYVFRTDSG